MSKLKFIVLLTLVTFLSPLPALARLHAKARMKQSMVVSMAAS